MAKKPAPAPDPAADKPAEPLTARATITAKLEEAKARLDAAVRADDIPAQIEAAMQIGGYTVALNAID